MDVMLLAVLLGFASVCIGLYFKRDSPYMGVLGGIVLILLGIFLATDGSITTLVCL